MNNILKKLKEKELLEISIIIFAIVLCTVLFANHTVQILSDRGRELFLSEAISQGKVPFKDILFLYFPLAYYINALFLKFSDNINCLTTLGILNSSVFAIFYFLIAKNFMKRNLSLLITLFVVVSCLINTSLFSYIFPYSYSMVYGLTAYLISIFFINKYIDKKKEKYFILSCLISGLAFSFKAEFLPIIFINLFFLFQSNEKVLTKIKGILSIFLFPTISFTIPIIQGASINHLIDFFKFFQTFSSTESMQYFYKDVGTILKANNVSIYINSIIGVTILSIFTIVTQLLYKKYQSKIILPVSLIIVFLITFIFMDVYSHFALLPVIVLVLFIIQFKKLLQNPKELIIVISALCLSIRTFSLLRVNMYGTYTLPLLIIALYVLISKLNIFEKHLKNIKIENIFSFIFLVYTLFFLSMNFISKNYCNTEIKTEKGTIFLPQSQAIPIKDTISFIKSNLKHTDKILVLPEGHIINFLSNRQTDNYNLHMLDRLYFDAIGENKAFDLLRQSNNDYLILTKGFNLSDFGQKFLYEENNKITKYIFENYELIKNFSNNENEIYILKRKI